jgi:hypothetical protein
MNRYKITLLVFGFNQDFSACGKDIDDAATDARSICDDPAAEFVNAEVLEFNVPHKDVPEIFVSDDDAAMIAGWFDGDNCESDALDHRIAHLV